MSSILKTLREPKVMDMAAFDFAATLLAARMLVGGKDCVSVAVVFILLIVMAILIHDARGIPTRLNAYLGLACVEDVYAARRRA